MITTNKEKKNLLHKDYMFKYIWFNCPINGYSDRENVKLMQDYVIFIWLHNLQLFGLLCEDHVTFS